MGPSRALREQLERHGGPSKFRRGPGRHGPGALRVAPAKGPNRVIGPRRGPRGGGRPPAGALRVEAANEPNRVIGPRRGAWSGVEFGEGAWARGTDDAEPWSSPTLEVRCADAPRYALHCRSRRKPQISPKILLAARAPDPLVQVKMMPDDPEKQNVRQRRKVPAGGE